MVEMYYNLVRNKKRTCNPKNTAVKQVPLNLREDVLSMLTSHGYDADGNKIV